MNTDVSLYVQAETLEATRNLAVKLAGNLRGDETIVLSADLGGGKTTFTGMLVDALGSKDGSSSPSFTLQNIYRLKKGEIHHFDFYRLNEPGIVAAELEESLHEPDVLTIIEWADIVTDVLPESRLTITITATSDDSREFKLVASKDLAYLLKGI